MFQSPDQQRFKRDSNGQWWYHFGKKNPSRIRASVVTCPECRDEFVQIPILRPQLDGTKTFPRHCSRRCGLLGSYRRTPDRFKGDNSRRWKGGRFVDKRGYVQVWSPNHPRRDGSTKKVYTLEHRLVMEKNLGRYLEDGEYVHHKNGIRDDNRLENLELWAKQQPPGQRVYEQRHCKTCTCDLD